VASAPCASHHHAQRDRAGSRHRYHAQDIAAVLTRLLDIAAKAGVSLDQIA
jgi:hypothetical protein